MLQRQPLEHNRLYRFRLYPEEGPPFLKTGESLTGKYDKPTDSLRTQQEGKNYTVPCEWVRFAELVQ